MTTIRGRALGAVRRWSACFSADPGLFGRAVLWRALLPLLKTLVPVRALASWMHRPVRPAGTEAREQRMATIELFLRQGGRLLNSPNCLERSLLLYRFLSEAGLAPSLVMGIRRDAAAVAGHAWIEIDGQPLGDVTSHLYDRIVWFDDGRTRTAAR